MPPLTLPFRPLVRPASGLTCAATSQYTGRTSFLVGRVAQSRHASILGSLKDNPGAYSKRIRRGRGPASGKGKTSGRGHKGQKQHGKVPAGFQGGQTPLEIVKGTRGFKALFTPELSLVNVDRIQEWIDQGRLDTSKPITVKELQESRCLHGAKDGVKLLARNAAALRHPIHITVSRASAAAIAAVESAGGSVQTRYYTRPSIRRILLGQTHPTLSILSTPPPVNPQTTSDATNLPPSTGESAEAKRPAAGATETQTAPSTNVPHASIFRAYPPPEAFQYRLPDAYSRRDLEYYRDPAHRGYLSYQVEEGAGPSLFFKTPRQLTGAAENAKRKTRKTKVGTAAASQNKMF